MLDGAWRSYLLYMHTAWPAVEARVVECKLSAYDDYNSSRRASGRNSYVRCSFEFEVAGYRRISSTDVGNPVFTSSELRTFLSSGVTLAQMRRWVIRHPPGSLQTIHFNPSQPQEISLAAAEEELENAPPKRSICAALIILCAAIVLIGLGRRIHAPIHAEGPFPRRGPQS
jgi:hypothetical protein